MANIAKITLPNNNTYDLKDAAAVRKSGDTMTGPLVVQSELYADSTTTGSLVATGASRFLNGLQGDLTGTIDGHTVEKDVPANAVFTDTTYSAATTTPLMDGTAAVGTSVKYAREDHRHPTDTSKVSVNANQGLTDTQKSNARSNIGLGTAAIKNYETAFDLNSESINVPTVSAVVTAIKSAIAASDALVFKGTLGTGGNPGSLPTGYYSVGWTYRVIEAGTYAGNNCQIGDLVIALVSRSGSGMLSSDWTVAQTNIDGAITKAGGVINGSLTVDNQLNANSVNVGNLVVTGDATFSNGLRGDLTGTINGGKPVLTSVSQGLTSTQQSNARANIGAGTSSLSLGTTSSTAYRGDYGNTAYTHATDANRLTTAKSSGLYKIAATAHGHVSSLTAVTKADITGLGIPSQDTQYPLASANLDGLMSSTDFKKINPQLLNSNDDLNNITTTGWYYCESTTTLTNAPTGQKFYLQVFGNDSGNIYQRIYGLKNYYRVYTSVGSGSTPAWISWVQYDFTDTKNTAGSTDTSSKIFLIGAKSQAANPQTYSDDQVYVTSGVLSVNSLNAGNYVAAYQGVRANTSNSGSAGGIALYASDPAAYGITMRNTGTSSGQMGKHGYVQGDWATYFTFSGAVNRGFIFRYGGTNVASINGEGKAVFNGSVTVGGNTTNTSGCRMVFNSTTQSLDFVFM